MAVNKNYFCIFDYETDELSIEKLNPIQLSAVIIEPLKLEIVEDSEFNSGICPDEIKESSYYDNHKQTIDWHCRNRSCSVEDFITNLKTYPSEKIVWTNFTEYLKKYNVGRGMWGAPIPVGENINNFDLRINDKLCRKYGNTDKNGSQNIMNTRDTIEMKQIYFMFFSNLADGPTSFSADNIYPWLGLSIEGRHDSLIDIRGCAKVFIRFMRYCRRHGVKANFKGSFANETY